MPQTLEELTVSHSRQYKKRKDTLQPYATEGPFIEPSSFYSRAAFEEIASYVILKRYELSGQNQRRAVDSLGVSRRTSSEWFKYLNPDIIFTNLSQKYSGLPEISGDSFYGKESLYKIMQHIVNHRIMSSASGKAAAKSLGISYNKMKLWMQGRGVFFHRRKEILAT